MIQDYLKTSLVFYDDIEKQHRYNECCQETTQYDGLISPTDRFLPFQIRIPTDEWFGDINTARLYDIDDNVVANLIIDYGIRPLLQIVSNCSWNDTYVWVIYAGGLLSANLPEGFHYIGITDDGGHTWYSEIFQICDMGNEGFDFGGELITEFTNENFDTFTSDGNEILSATEVLGEAGCHSNSLSGCAGDRLYYDIDFVNNQPGTTINVYAYDGANVVSNIIALTVTGHYTGVLTLTATGDFEIRVETGPIGNYDFSGTFSFRGLSTTTFDGVIGLEWWNDCDFDGIIYQSKDTWYTTLCGYSNKLYFQKHLESPRTETTRDEAERLGTRFVRSIVQKKYYMFKVLVPEFLYNVLQSVVLYANPVRSGVMIYLDNGDIGYIEELNIANEEWTEGNCYCHLTIEFREDAVVWTNCCDNYALRDESSCS